MQFNIFISNSKRIILLANIFDNTFDYLMWMQYTVHRWVCVSFKLEDVEEQWTLVKIGCSIWFTFIH